jgi:hypothetical protein
MGAETVAIVTKFGIMRVHKHWMDPIPVIVARAERDRTRGVYSLVDGEWVWIKDSERKETR